MERQLIQQRLTAAETALFNLMTGSREEEVRQADGSMVRYVPSTMKDLKTYIAYLQALLRPRRPIHFGFGR